MFEDDYDDFDNPMNDDDVVRLFNEYNDMFPDNQIDEEYVRGYGINEIIDKLNRAIKDNEPIRRYYR
jgi:hypothetical protein